MALRASYSLGEPANLQSGKVSCDKLVTRCNVGITKVALEPPYEAGKFVAGHRCG